MKNKEFDKDSLNKLYYSCPLFKKYCKLGLWFGSIEEYKNIKYCEKYLQMYTYALFQNNNLFKDDDLILNPNFVKFIHSEFFYHVNSHFLIAFYENSFLSSFPESKIKIEIFVEDYFRIYLQEKFKKEFLLQRIKFINKFAFNFADYFYSDSVFVCLSSINSNRSFIIKSKLTEKKDIQLLFERDNFFSCFSKKKKVLVYIIL